MGGARTCTCMHGLRLLVLLSTGTSIAVIIIIIYYIMYYNIIYYIIYIINYIIILYITSSYIIYYIIDWPGPFIFHRFLRTGQRYLLPFVDQRYLLPFVGWVPPNPKVVRWKQPLFFSSRRAVAGPIWRRGTRATLCLHPLSSF